MQITNSINMQMADNDIHEFDKSNVSIWKRSEKQWPARNKSGGTAGKQGDGNMQMRPRPSS